MTEADEIRKKINVVCMYSSLKMVSIRCNDDSEILVNYKGDTAKKVFIKEVKR